VDAPVGFDYVALLGGLTPTAPEPPVPPDEEVAVAVWRGDGLGAVLSIWHDPEDDEEPYAQDITIFEIVDGRWTWRSKGGSDWPVEYGERPAFDRPMLTGTGSGPLYLSGGSAVWLASGIAPPGVERIRVLRGGFATEAEVEPVTGAFLVGLPEVPHWSFEISAVPT
jgi:hypothetical protein